MSPASSPVSTQQFSIRFDDMYPVAHCFDSFNRPKCRLCKDSNAHRSPISRTSPARLYFDDSRSNLRDVRGRECNPPPYFSTLSVPTDGFTYVSSLSFPVLASALALLVCTDQSVLTLRHTQTSVSDVTNHILRSCMNGIMLHVENFFSIRFI